MRVVPAVLRVVCGVARCMPVGVVDSIGAVNTVGTGVKAVHVDTAEVFATMHS